MDPLEILRQMADNAAEAEAREQDDLRVMYRMGQKEAFLTAIQVINNPADFG